LNAPAGLVGTDGSPKPAFDALHRLITGDWWLPPTPMTTDGQGRLRFGGFLGEYEISSAGRSAVVRLERPGELALDIVLP
jgi:hypothetical protein